MTPDDYLVQLHGAAATGWVSVWHKDTKAVFWFRANDLVGVVRHLEQYALLSDVYLSWNRYREQLGSKSRGSMDQVLGTSGILFDADLRSTEGAHSKTALPESREAAEDFLVEAGVPLPTTVINSGNGLYWQWRLPAPVDFATNDAREAFQALSKRFHNALIAAGRELHGWSFDYTGDLARVTRVPGTLNHKTAPAKPVTLLSHQPERTYPLVELEAIAAALEARYRKNLAAPRSKQGPKPKTQKSGTSNGPLPNLESVERGCAWMRSVRERAERLPEPEWYAAASIIGKCEGGREAFHDLSSADPRYQWAETEAKLDHALTSAGPRSCANIATELGSPACADCPIFGKISGPIQLGRLDPDVAELLRRTVYDGDSVRFLDLPTDLLRTEKQVTNDFAHLDPRQPMRTTLLQHRWLRKVDRAEYLPGVPERFVTLENGVMAVNLWRKGGAAPEPGEPEMILEHFRYLMPDPCELDHVLDVLASQVQNPGAKIKHGLILGGKQGTGKSFIGKLLEAMFGAANVRTVASNDLVSEWNARLCNTQVLVCEELMAGDRMEAANRLKTLLTEERELVNEKHVKKFHARTPRLILALTNHDMPIRMEQSDRRWFLSFSMRDPRPQQYYDRLHSEGLAEAGRFLRWLGERDLSAFSPDAPPPVTAAKRAVIEWSRPQVTQEVEALVEAEAYPFGSAVFLWTSVLRVVQDRFGKGRLVTQRELNEALESIGASQVKQVRLYSSRLRVWALRDHAKWMAASPAEIDAELRAGGYTPLLAE